MLDRPMGRWRWVFGWLCCAFFVSFARPAWADDGFAAIRVCVRPDIVPPSVAAWVFTSNADSYVVKISRTDFKKQAGGLTTYVYDPYAPPSSVKLFPAKYAHLVCPPPPNAAAAPAETTKDDPAKAGDKKPVAVDGAIAGDAKKKREKEKDNDDEPPPGTPPPIVYPRKGEPLPPLIPPLPKGGVTENWPRTVLPIRKEGSSVLPSVASGHGVLPIAGLGGKGTVLPIAGARPQVPPSDLPPNGEAKGSTKEATGDGTKKGNGVEKTVYEKWCEQVGLLGGVANLQLSEDIKRLDGSKYGIPGGKNPNGIKSPTAQAAAGAVMVAAAVITAGGFDKKLYDALAKGTPIFIRGGGKAAEQAAEKLVQDAIAKYGVHGAEDLAAALAKNGAIGEYSVMAKFTQGLGAKWQAHHILEVSAAKKLQIVATDRLPSVILSEADHKAMTALLAIKTKAAQTPAQLLAGYVEAYDGHPAWLAAIRGYFIK